MHWAEIRSTYPRQWLVIEALTAYTTPQQRRQLEELAVVAQCNDGQAAMNKYRELHQLYPSREFYFVHTSREELNIRVRHWLGVRTAHELGN